MLCGSVVEELDAPMAPALRFNAHEDLHYRVQELNRRATAALRSNELN